MPIFHHLPKIHKGLHPLTGRPIVAGIGSLNERLGEWVDRQLQPLVTALPVFLRDTKQLLLKLDGFAWEKNYRWVSCDVSSLYFSIQHHLGLQAVSHFLRESGSFSLILQEFIISSLEYLLTPYSLWRVTSTQDSIGKAQPGMFYCGLTHHPLTHYQRYPLWSVSQTQTSMQHTRRFL